MRFKIEIACDNAAFGHNDMGVRSDEIERILIDYANGIGSRYEHPSPGTVTTLHDVNGNIVGYAMMEG